MTCWTIFPFIWISPQVIPSTHAIIITRMLASWQEGSAPLRHVWIHIKLPTWSFLWMSLLRNGKYTNHPEKKQKNIRSSHMRSQYSHLWDGPKDVRIEAAMCFKGAAMVGVECSFPQTKHQGEDNVADQFFFRALNGKVPQKTVRVTAWTHKTEKMMNHERCFIDILSNSQGGKKRCNDVART